MNQFEQRHIGIQNDDLLKMLEIIGVDSIETLIQQTIPSNILTHKPLNLPKGMREYDFLQELKNTASKNKIFKTYIGNGFYNTITPSPILRNVFQNPGWYTQYTPYQAEISQGRLEALLNFQTMITDLTALPIANASLLDEATAAAEAMHLLRNVSSKKIQGKPVFIVSKYCFESTIEVLKTRANGLGIEIIIEDEFEAKYEDNVFGVLIQYPRANGDIKPLQNLISSLHEKQILVAVSADLMSLALLIPPGELGADVALGSTQRFGVPMGFGGPHAAYFACKDEYKRQIPGRIIGISIDAHGNTALRMALQTREQHIRREKATSNICTAQALLAIMASMYAVYHGENGIKRIAYQIHALTTILAENLKKIGFQLINEQWFDTISIAVSVNDAIQIKTLSENNNINFFYNENTIQISLDETTTITDIELIIKIFALAKNEIFEDKLSHNKPIHLSTALIRKSSFLKHPVFNSYRSETELMRYIKRLENKDLSLVHAMIPLGSCTMKLNSASSLLPVSWSEFADIHPYAPKNQTKGYQQIISELEKFLCECTGFDACSLQPNSGAQGEYAGLMCIKAYHENNGEAQRNIALIPSSAHGTNPASAVMAGMRVIVVECDVHGNIKVEDLIMKAELYANELSCLMVTYPSTHGVFEEKIQLICDTIHKNGGLVYMDGANMNAQVGLTSPGIIGADVCHLNLHKTFSIPHGGGGPGVGPICVNNKLAAFLPSHPIIKTGGKKAITAISAAPWGSASILLISYAYIKMLGAEGLKNASQYAILNANYIKSKLDNCYKTLYVGKTYGRVAHELIIDLRDYKTIGIEAEDIAKRLIDYGFHAPTLSFPVAGTIMIEPTESESLFELNRFCEAMIEIKNEIDEIAKGEYSKEINVLKNAPHCLQLITSDDWSLPYTRQKAAYPVNHLLQNKFWVYVGRLNNSFGDRNLVCTCMPIEAYK
jgi:glycine dehydrogenase